MKGEEVQKDSGHDQLASNMPEAVPADDFIGNKFPSPETHEALHPSQSNDALLSRVCRNFSNVTEVSDDNTVSKCDCASKNGAIVVAGRTAQPHHSCCHLSAFLALLALHKVSMCDRGTRVNDLSEAKPEGRATNSHVDNVANSGTSVAEEPQHSTFSNANEAHFLKKPQSRGPWEAPYPASDNFDARKSDSNEVKRSESSSSEFRANPFDVQVQPNSSDATGQGKQGRPRFKSDSSDSRAQPSNRGRGFKSNLSTSQGGSTNNVAQNCFEQTPEVEKAARPKTNNKQGESKSFSATFRPRRSGKSGDSGSFHQRGKPRRRGNGRQNLPRRPYVDLDDPKPIASQHQRQ